MALVRDQQQIILELSSRLSFYQSEISHLQAQFGAAQEWIALLQALKESAEAATSNQSTLPTPYWLTPLDAGQARVGRGQAGGRGSEQRRPVRRKED